MKIILLSGGSGKRLWPLSNDSRSKQFLKVLTSPSGEKESMIQGVVRQIRSSQLSQDIIIITSLSQKDQIISQLGENSIIVTEPSRRDTFPAILLACSYLLSNDNSLDEPVIVMPCDTFTENNFFSVIKQIEEAIIQEVANIVLMGIVPTSPSSQYGYILPTKNMGVIKYVEQFIEKPNRTQAEKLIEEGALWNAGIFGFKLEYIKKIIETYLPYNKFEDIYTSYNKLPKISFDYEVVEKESSIAVVPYKGIWKDLGTWNTLTSELSTSTSGNVILESCHDTYGINELNIPILCIGLDNIIVAASHDGILVSDKHKSELVKQLTSQLSERPMYEERRWGKYKVIDYIKFTDGSCALTKQLLILPGRSISYQKHNYREEIWTVVHGKGELILDGERKIVTPGTVIQIQKQQLHAIRAITELTIIEVQQGSLLIEEDIERFEFEW